MRKTNAAGKESNDSATVCLRATYADVAYGHIKNDVTSYFRSAFIDVRKKTADNGSSEGFGSNFIGAAFCLAQPIGGFLVFSYSSTLIYLRSPERLDDKVIVSFLFKEG